MGELEHSSKDNGELVRRYERTGQCLRHSKKATSKTNRHCTGEDHFFLKIENYFNKIIAESFKN